MKKLLLTTFNVCVFLQSQIIQDVVAASSMCSESDTKEAERAFKNCVESSQSSLVTASNRGDLDQNGLCAELDRMFSLCQDQKHQLALCKGREHAEKIQNIHVSVTADIIRSINRNIALDECHLETLTLENGHPRDDQTWDGHNNNNNNNNDDDHHEDRSGDGTAAVPPKAEPWPSESKPKTASETNGASSSFGTLTYLFLLMSGAFMLCI